MKGEFWNMGILNPEIFQSNSLWLDVVKCLLTIVLLQLFTSGEIKWRIYFHKAFINILYHRDALNIFRIKNVLRHSSNEMTKKLHALEIRLARDKEERSITTEELRNKTIGLLLEEEKILRKETEQRLADVETKNTELCKLYEQECSKREQAVAESINLGKVNSMYLSKLYVQDTKLVEMKEHVESSTLRVESAKRLEEVSLIDKQLAEKERDKFARNLKDLNNQMADERQTHRLQIQESVLKNKLLLKKYACLKWKYICSKRGSCLTECTSKNTENAIQESVSKNELLLKKYACLKWKYMCLICSKRGPCLKEIISKNTENIVRALGFLIFWCLLLVPIGLLLINLK